MPRAREELTPDFFDVPVAPAPTGGSLDYANELRAELSAALKETPLSRYEVAARMSELTGHEITKTMLDSWTAESKSPWRFPFEYAAAFETACGTTRLQALFGRKRGSRVLVGEEVLFAELGRIEQAEVQLAARKKLLRERLKVAPVKISPKISAEARTLIAMAIAQSGPLGMAEPVLRSAVKGFIAECLADEIVGDELRDLQRRGFIQASAGGLMWHAAGAEK